MKLKRKVLISVISIMLFFTLASCVNSGVGNGDDNNTDKNVPKTDFPNRLEPAEYGADCMTELANDYVLVWADEFNYSGELDSSKWNYEVGTGDGGWGNGEKQFYTNRLDNVLVHDGHLTITAKRENYSGSEYTSGRVTTKAKGDWTYGFVEVCAKLPTGQGTWPAIWMMPSNNNYGWWPNSGEIDIMEEIGNTPNRILGTVHTGDYNHLKGTQKGSYTTISNSQTGYNRYQMEWTDTYIKMLVNDQPYFTFYRDVNNPDYMKWPFDQPFHILLNVAMGGSLGGYISPSFTESSMDVDYVRVYKKNDTSDKEKPDVVNITSVTPTSNSIHLMWDKASDNQGIKHYEIVVNDRQVVATTATNFTLTNLNPDTEYQIRIIAVDYNNNYSLSEISKCKTNGTNVIPGIIKGYEYACYDGQGVSIINGNDTNQSQILNIESGTTIEYQGICNKSGSYSLYLRYAATLNSTLSIEVYANGNLINEQNLSINRSYGSYRDIALNDKINLPNGNITIKITCKSTTKGNAMQLNYLNIVG